MKFHLANGIHLENMQSMYVILKILIICNKDW